MNFATKAQFKGIQSFFCEDGWSAAIVHNNQPQELVDCGDTVPETTIPVPADRITIGPCMQRRCCFYSGKNKDGNEYCMYAEASVEAELKNAQAEPFLVGECLSDWKAELVGKNGKVNVDCGVTLDLDAKNTYDKITLTPCKAPPVKAAAETELVLDTLGEDDFDATFQDQAVADTFEGEDEFAEFETEDDFQGDFAVADENEEEMLNDDEFLADASLDQALADVANDEDLNHGLEEEFADDFADQAFADFDEEEFVGDYNDQAVMDAFNEELAFSEEDEFAGDYFDEAVADEEEEDNFDQVFEEEEFVGQA
jgi:hypothetical protein